jgi:hypothetical protein
MALDIAVVLLATNATSGSPESLLALRDLDQARECNRLSHSPLSYLFQMPRPKPCPPGSAPIPEMESPHQLSALVCPKYRRETVDFLIRTRLILHNYASAASIIAGNNQLVGLETPSLA